MHDKLHYIAIGWTIRRTSACRSIRVTLNRSNAIPESDILLYVNIYIYIRIYKLQNNNIFERKLIY